MISEPPQTLGQAFSRGFKLKCPMCSAGRLFSGFIKMQKNARSVGFGSSANQDIS